MLLLDYYERDVKGETSRHKENVLTVSPSKGFIPASPRAPTPRPLVRGNHGGDTMSNDDEVREVLDSCSPEIQSTPMRAHVAWKTPSPRKPSPIRTTPTARQSVDSGISPKSVSSPSTASLYSDKEDFESPSEGSTSIMESPLSVSMSQEDAQRFESPLVRKRKRQSKTRQDSAPQTTPASKLEPTSGLESASKQQPSSRLGSARKGLASEQAAKDASEPPGYSLLVSVLKGTPEKLKTTKVPRLSQESSPSDHKTSPVRGSARKASSAQPGRPSRPDRSSKGASAPKMEPTSPKAASPAQRTVAATRNRSPAIPARVTETTTPKSIISSNIRTSSRNRKDSLPPMQEKLSVLEKPRTRSESRSSKK